MPPRASPSGRVVRFGIFEVDLLAGELRKNGIRLRLQEQPFQILALLLERSGDVVTREELRQKLWPADTFVDFDHSLNTAVNKIRDALGDSATSPTFLETLARRGYRFIAPVQFGSPTPPGRTFAGNEDTAFASPPAFTNSPPVLTASAIPESPRVTDSDLPLAHRGVTRGLLGLIQIMYLSFYLAALFRLREIDRISDSFFPGSISFAIVAAVLVTAGVGIPLRCYLLSAIGFDYPKLGEKFSKLFVFILLLDDLWAVAPFLLIEKIGLGLAFAATAALLYVPFSQRTLVRMAYRGR